MHRGRGEDIGSFIDVCEEKLLHVVDERIMVMTERDWSEGIVVCWGFFRFWGEDAGNVFGGAVIKSADEGELYKKEG